MSALKVIYASRMCVLSAKCLVNLEIQLVKNQGFISLPSFITTHVEQLMQWQDTGYLTLKIEPVEELSQELVQQNGITHFITMSDELWIASAGLRRIHANGYL